MAIKRRTFIKTAAIATASGLMPNLAKAKKGCAKGKVIIIGGGYAGATAAKHIAMWSDNIDVIMIERNKQFVSCPQSNLIFSGARQMSELTHDYSGLTTLGVQVIHSTVTKVDTEQQHITLADDVSMHYDRLVIAPGIDFILDDLPMLANEQAQQKVPSAWKAGPQTLNLKHQIMQMPQGGKVVMSIPLGPMRCPPGPYERACQVANYLKNNNPSAKLIVLDANPNIISKKRLFESAWQTYYADYIDYVPNSQLDSVDVDNLIVETEFEQYQADVLNVIPPQKAGKVAELAGVINVDNRWCEVDFTSYESKVKPKVHVIGDAIAAKLPKSGHMANSQAKICAAAIVEIMAGRQPEPMPEISNICYSFVDQKQAMHVSAIYQFDPIQQQMVSVSGNQLSERESQQEGELAEAWATNIWNDVLK